MFRTKLPDQDKTLLEEEIIDDRGETKYFHGRENEKKYFLRLLSRSIPGKKGSCFLVQGPPGVGKSAFLAECRKKAEEEGWSTAKIRPGALWDTDILRECLGEAKRRLTGLSAEIGLDVASLGVAFDLDKDISSPIHALRSKDTPIVLILDEAQRLKNLKLIPDGQRESVTSLLEYIHNGDIGRPLVLLIGGLGNTQEAFQDLDISRFKSNCYFNLEALSRAEERGVIKDWLTKEGKAKGDITAWGDVITAETHGWGHHIASYLDPALEYLKESEGEMTTEGLRIVMEKGRANRWAYYTGRTEGLADDHIVRLVEMFRDTPVEEGFRKQDLVAELGKPGFAQAVSRGVLYYSNPLYTLPIPSLYDCLTERASHIREATLRYERVKKQRQASHHLTRESSEPKPLSEADPEKEPETHKTDSFSPEKEEGEKSTTPKSGKDHLGQDTPQGKDPSGSDQGTDMGMER